MPTPPAKRVCLREYEIKGIIASIGREQVCRQQEMAELEQDTSESAWADSAREQKSHSIFC
jgi:hypothetical protein